MNSITANPADIITGPLEKHFPVSTGNDHRERENATGEDADLPVYEEVDEEPSEVSNAVLAQLLSSCLSGPYTRQICRPTQNLLKIQAKVRPKSVISLQIFEKIGEVVPL